MVFLLCAHKCPETYRIIIYYIFEFIKNIFRIFYFSLCTLGTRLYKNIKYYNIRSKTIIKIGAQTSAQIDQHQWALSTSLWALLKKYIIKEKIIYNFILLHSNKHYYNYHTFLCHISPNTFSNL